MCRNVTRRRNNYGQRYVNCLRRRTVTITQQAVLLQRRRNSVINRRSVRIRENEIDRPAEAITLTGKILITDKNVITRRNTSVRVVHEIRR